MFKSNMSKVSIIIPCYNKASFIAESIESALNQTYKNIEIIIINDGSTDTSADIIKKYSEKFQNIVFIDEKVNCGVVFARNKAIEIATGKYILPLDADDFIEKTYVEKAVKILDEKPDVGVVYCNYKIFGDKVIYSKPLDIEYILFDAAISATSMFRKKDFLSLGKYKECMNAIGCEDCDLWISFFKAGYNFYHIDEYLLNYRKINTESCRTDIQIANEINIYKNLMKNHFNLYLQSDEFLYRVFSPAKSEFYEKYNKKLKKYRKLFQLFLYLLICSFALILYLLFKKFILL